MRTLAVQSSSVKLDLRIGPYIVKFKDRRRDVPLRA